MDDSTLSDHQEVNNLVEIFNSRLNKIRELYDEGMILMEDKYIEETEKIIQKIEEITGRYSIE